MYKALLVSPFALFALAIIKIPEIIKIQNIIQNYFQEMRKNKNEIPLERRSRGVDHRHHGMLRIIFQFIW